MDYLVVALSWYLAAAFIIGVLVGWFSCSSGRNESASGKVGTGHGGAMQAQVSDKEHVKTMG